MSPHPESQVPGQRGAAGECRNPWRTQVKHPQLESSLGCCYQQWALPRSPSRRLVSEHLQHPSGVQPGFLPGQSDTATGPRVGVDHIVPAGKVCAVSISVLSLAVMWVIPASLTFFSQCMLTLSYSLAVSPDLAVFKPCFL